MCFFTKVLGQVLCQPASACVRAVLVAMFSEDRAGRVGWISLVRSVAMLAMRVETHSNMGRAFVISCSCLANTQAENLKPVI